PGIQAEAGSRPRNPGNAAHHARQGRHLSGHLHRAVRARSRADALASRRDGPERVREVGGEEGTMTTAVEQHDAAPVRHGPPPPPRGWHRLLYPGFLRAAWMTPLFFGIGSEIVVLCRWWGGWDPIWLSEIIVLVGALIAA